MSFRTKLENSVVRRVWWGGGGGREGGGQLKHVKRLERQLW